TSSIIAAYNRRQIAGLRRACRKSGQLTRRALSIVNPGQRDCPRLYPIRRSVNALNSGLALDETGAKRIVDSRRERIQFQHYEEDHHFASAHQNSSTQEPG